MKQLLLSGLVMGLVSSQALCEPIALSDQDLETVSAGLFNVEVYAPTDIEVNPEINTYVATPINNSVQVTVASVINAFNEGNSAAGIAQIPITSQDSSISD